MRVTSACHVKVCEDIELSCQCVIDGSSDSVAGIGACGPATAAAIKSRIALRRALHRSRPE
jgi:hypothetical protein